MGELNVDTTKKLRSNIKAEATRIKGDAVARSEEGAPYSTFLQHCPVWALQPFPVEPTAGGLKMRTKTIRVRIKSLQSIYAHTWSSWKYHLGPVGI